MRNSKYPSGKAVDISLLLRFEREQKGWSIEYASKNAGSQFSILMIWRIITFEILLEMLLYSIAI